MPEGEDRSQLSSSPTVVGGSAGSPELMTDLAQVPHGGRFPHRQHRVHPLQWRRRLPVGGRRCRLRRPRCRRSSGGGWHGRGPWATQPGHISLRSSLSTPVCTARGCALTEPTIPDRLVGLAGPSDVARIGPLILPFFGVRPNENPEMWQAGNPLNQVANNPDLISLIMHGEDDGLVDLSFATDFAEALTGAGSEAVVEVVEGASQRDA